MKVKVITLFPDAVKSMLSVGVIGKALEKGIWTLEIVDLKGFGPHIDGRPCGGGPGMIIKLEVLEKVLEKSKNIYFTSPRGELFHQKYAEELTKLNEITILCGRYEGIDQRAIDYYNLTEISIGKYILCGGEIAACTILESTLRLLPNVLSNTASIENESYSNMLIEHDHYTLPKVWKNLPVPDVLLCGNHDQISNFQYINSLYQTYKHKEEWKKYQIFFVQCLIFFMLYGSKKKITHIKKYIDELNLKYVDSKKI